MRRLVLVTVVLAAAGLGAIWYLSAPRGGAHVDVVIPALSEAGGRGQAAYGRYCAECHGAKADGSDKGPPLIHKIYEPGHHGNSSIATAVRRGASGHHWPYGDMKPVKGVTDQELVDMIAFIRETQYGNGIF
jgi:mono/diheme cytochrome c family protein